ncbi:MAG: acetate--CoA ligase family protein [Pseudomonadota bacterium]|nr:acetate--CoA ligase family protein [Pseudomonadota bacterium]
MKSNTVNLARTRHTNLQRLLVPGSIAVVGASADAAKVGAQALRSLRGFPGGIYPINPRQPEIQGLRCYPSISALPLPVDLAVLAIPAEHCVTAAREAAAAGVGGIFIVSGGFGETGSAGANLQAELAAVCRETGLRLLGPNTSGFINPHAACVACFVPGVDQLGKGRIGVIAQSGGVNLSVAFLLDRLGEGLSMAIGLGNAVDVDAADVLALLADDPHTSAIALHLEGVPKGRELFEVVRTAVLKKPVVALVAGRSDIGEFAVSHTGNLMGSRQRSVAALTQAGAVIVESTEDLAQAVAVLAERRLPARRHSRFGLVTGQAGPGLLIVDGLKTAGIDVPELAAATVQRVQSLLPPLTFVKNPVDTGRPGPTFAQVVAAVAGDPHIDAVLVYGLSEPAVLDPSAALLPALAESGKPIVFGTLGLMNDVQPALASLRQAGISAVQSPERLTLAAIALSSDASGRLRRPAAAIPAVAGTMVLRGPYDEYRAKELLASYGIASPQRVLCGSRQAAIAAFDRMRKPVVAKIVAADIAHKTEAGGVHLDLRSESQLLMALDAIDRIATRHPGQVLIEEMAPEGVELIVGGVRDESWGPCVVIGLGGVMAEALADTAVRLAPLAAADVEDMLDSLRGRKLLEGFRHLPVCSRTAIIEAVLGLATLLQEHPEVREVEINPLRVNATSALALDALVVLDAP